MADLIKIKSKASGAVKGADEIYGMLPQEQRKQGEDANAFATRLAKEYPDQYEIASTPAPPSVGGFMSNLGGDVVDTVKGLANVPGAVKDLGMGAYHLATGKLKPEDAKANLGNIWDSFKEQYSKYYGPLAQGDFQKFGSNVYDHPGQILNDVATVATAGDWGAALAGAKGTARVLGKIAAVTDPITATVKVGQQVAKVATKVPAINNAVTKLYSWALDQNLPTSVLTDKAATEAAKAKNLKTAETGLKYGVRLDRQGAEKAATINDTLHEARGGSVAALPQNLHDVQSIIEPDIQEILLGKPGVSKGQSNQIGSNARDIESTFNKQAAEEIRGADVELDKDGNAIGDRRFLSREFDPSRTYVGPDGNPVRPALKTPLDMQESIKNGNKALQDMYEAIDKTGGMETKTKLEAQKSIIESYRKKLDELVGDVPVTLQEGGKPVVYKFKDLGIDQSKLINLGQQIHETIFASRPTQALSPKAISAQGFFKAMKDAVHTPQTAARIAVFVKGTNPSTMAKTRVLTSAGHVANKTQPIPQTKPIPQPATPWDNEIKDQGTPWDNEIKR